MRNDTMQTINNENNTLKPIGVWNILDMTYSLYRKHFSLFLGITAIFFFSNIIEYSIKGFFVKSDLRQIIASLTAMPFAVLSMGGIVVAASTIYFDKEITSENALLQSLKHLVSLMISHIKWRMAQVIPLVLIIVSTRSIISTGSISLVVLTVAICLPFLIYFSVRWIFYLETVLLEKCSLGDALRRSSELVENNWWQVFGTLLLILLSSYAIQYIFEFSIGLVFIIFDIAGGANFRTILEWSIMDNVLDTSSYPFYLIMIASKLFLNALILPIWVIGVMLVYIDRRIQKEGMISDIIT